MGKTTLAPGFRFSPTDVELVKYYLKRKVMGKKLHFEGIAEVDIYKFAPWDLPDKSYLRSGDLKWYFYCPREKKYASGTRLNRATDFGYWKTTGKDRPVHYNNEVTGMIKTLVFHQGKAPHGDRTNWVMHEYRLQDKDLVTRQVVQDAYVLCVIFKKDGLGPRNGAQYGAPFREEDWSDDEEEVNCTEAVSSAGLLAPVLAIPPNQMDTGASSSRVPVPEHQRVGSSSNSCASDIVPSAYNVIQTPDIGRSDPMPMEVSQVPDHDILSMLAVFTDYDTPALNDNGQNQERPAHLNHAGNVAAPTPLNGNDIYNELSDLGTLGKLNDGAYNLSNAYAMTMVTPADHAFLELLDLDPPLNCAVQDPSLHCTVQDPSLDSTVKDPPSSSSGLQYLPDNVPPHPVLGSGHLSPFNGYGNY